MPSVVQFGAGAIGRGFLAPLWSEAGYEVVFVEIDQALVEALNTTHSYPLRLVDNAGAVERVIGPVRALHTDEIEAIQQALEECAFAATAVHTQNLPAVANLLRLAKGARGMPVLVCENGHDPASVLRSLVAPEVRLHNGIIGRAVPPPTLTEVVAEPYGDLRVAPALPWAIPGVFVAAHYDAEVARKLYLHNGGHFYLACLGLQHGYPFLWQAAEDAVLVAQLEAFWAEVRAGLCMAYGLTNLDSYTAELLRRFRNRPLSDPCARIARDPSRKLAPGERLLGAQALCEQHELPTQAINRAIAVAERRRPRSSG